MATLIFDLETTGEDWETLDDTTRSTLTHWIERSAKSETEKQVRLRDVKEGLGFSPLTGSIVALGIYDLERAAGVVYYMGADTADLVEGDFTFKTRTEAALLAEFWQGAKHYDTFVTFNGRAFDLPFLMHRSAINGLRPTVDLLRVRYLYQQGEVRHIDLQEQLTWYGAMSRRPSLHLFCRAYGIDSPKIGGVSGDNVTELFQAGRGLDIARYNARDVIATAKLYQVWLDYFAPTDPLIEY